MSKFLPGISQRGIHYPCESWKSDNEILPDSKWDRSHFQSANLIRTRDWLRFPWSIQTEEECSSGWNNREKSQWKTIMEDWNVTYYTTVDEIIIFLLSSNGRIFLLSNDRFDSTFRVSFGRYERNRTIFLYIYVYHIMALPREKVGCLFHVEERRCPYRPRLFYTSATAE